MTEEKCKHSIMTFQQTYFEKSPHQDTYCNVLKCNCNDQPDCYYKQLKRKKQEYEELEHKLDIAKKALSFVAGYGCDDELKTKYQLRELCIIHECEECYERVADQALEEMEKIIWRFNRKYWNK